MEKQKLKEPTTTIKVSTALIEQIQKKYPIYQNLPITYIVDVILREKLNKK